MLLANFGQLEGRTQFDCSEEKYAREGKVRSLEQNIYDAVQHSSEAVLKA